MRLALKVVAQNDRDVVDVIVLYIAEVGTTWILLHSPREGQATLYLFQKHFLQSLWTFLKRTDNSWWRVRNSSPLTSLPFTPYANK